MDVILTNARDAKGDKARQTDVIDAEWLADLLRHGLPKPSFIPPLPIRELRDLVLQLYLAIPLWRGAYSATTALWLDGGAATGTKRGLLLLEGLVPTPTTIPAAAPRARSAAGAPRRGGCR